MSAAPRSRRGATGPTICGPRGSAAAGSLARLGGTGGRAAGQMAASAILRAGFLMAGPLDKGAKAVKAAREGTGAPAGD